MRGPAVRLPGLGLTLRIVGNVLIAMSVIGLLALGWLVITPEDATNAVPSGTNSARDAPAPANAPFGVFAWTGVFDRHHSSSSSSAAQPAALDVQSAASLETATVRPITRIEIPSIDLDAEVVPAELVAVQGGYTWQVPAFKVGHAESTTGAGQTGNAVLLGHVTSVHSGNVFQDLDQVHVDDAIYVFSDSDEFDYQVVSTTHVPRSDSSVLEPTQTSSISLITCTGVWLPTIWDYTERLVVRAELSG